VKELCEEDVEKLRKFLSWHQDCIMAVLRGMGYLAWGSVHENGGGIWLRIHVYGRG